MAVLKKILFKNKRVGGTPVNAPNLNQVQDNTQEALNTLETDTNKRIEIIDTNAQNELERIKSNLINLSAEGEEIQANDSSDLSAKIDVRGNTKQNGEPTPDYPQEIESVKAYNMVNIPRELKTFNEYYSYPIDIKKGTYTIYTSKIETDGANNFSILFANETGAYQEIIAKKEQQYYTITLNKDYVRMQIYPQTSTANSKGKTTTFYDLMVYEGTEQKPYQKYGEIAVKQTGKNLFNKELYQENRIVEETTGKIEGNSFYSTSNFIEINPNKDYTISWGKSTNNNIVLRYCFYDMNKKYIKGEKFGLYVFYNKTIKAPDNARYLVFSLLDRVDNIDVIRPNIQLEEGTSATKDELYKETIYPLHLGNIELNKIGDSQDYFHKVGNKWYLHKNYHKVAFFGNEEIRLQSINSKGISNFGYTKKYTGVDSIALSNYFILQRSLIANESQEGFLSNEDLIYFRVKKERASTIEQFKQLLKLKYNEGNPIEVIYRLKTPIETEITDPILIKQLDDLEKAQTFKPTTILTNNSIAIMKLDYIADTKTYIDNLIKPKEQIQQAIPQTIPENKELEK